MTETRPTINVPETEQTKLDRELVLIGWDYSCCCGRRHQDRAEALTCGSCREALGHEPEALPVFRLLP